MWVGCPQGSDDAKTPTPVELQIDLDCPQESDDITSFTPLKLQIDLGFTQGLDDIKIPTNVEPHVWLEMPTRIKWYQKSRSRGISR